MQKVQTALQRICFGTLCLLTLSRLSAQVPLKIEKIMYRPPLDGVLELSAPFGEFRNNHFHSGVDYRIGGKAGASVYAVLDGYVSRIVVRPDGFGKAVYVNHANGKTSVYAHLDAFADSVAAYVRAKQYATRQFAQDLSLRPGELPVVQGQVLGYGGDSGSSRGPHLHFELRSQKTEFPRNYFADNIFRPKDTIAPVLSDLVVYQMDTLLGLPISRYSDVAISKGKGKKNKSGVKNNDTIVVPQTCYLGIIASDQINGIKMNNSVYLIRLLVDGVTCFEWTNDAFSFARTRFANALGDGTAAAGDGRTVLRTYKHKSWEVDFIKVSRMEGIIRLRPNQIRRINIRLEDESGNRTDFSCLLKGADRRSAYVLPPHIKRDSSWMAVPMGKKMELKRKSFGLTFPANALYEGIIVKADPVSARHSAVGEVLQISCLDIPGSYSGTSWHAGVKLSYPEKEIPAALQGKVTWAYEKITKENARSKTAGVSAFAGALTTASKNGYLECTVRGPGNYGFCVDTVSPVIGFKNVIENEVIGTKSRIEIDVRDNFSGVTAVDVFWNEAWILSDYDQKNRLLSVSVQGDLKGREPEGVLRVCARDALGNESSKKIALKL